MGHRDFKNTPRQTRGRATSPRRSGGGGGVMVGVIIGLIIGVAAVVGVVMYFSHAATPFTNLVKMQESASQVGAVAASTPTQILTPGQLDQESSSAGPAVAPAATNSSAAASTTAAPAQTPPKKNKGKNDASAAGDDGQRFDFYKILPGQLDAVASGNPATAPAAGDQAANKPNYLQLGSFQNQDDADNLKAKLALLGVEASIQSISIPGKGMVHRVIIGPFAGSADINRIKAQLKQDGINLAVKLTN